MKDIPCFVALGSNLGNCFEQLMLATHSLAASSAIFDLVASRVYETEPISCIPQPRYLNAALFFRTSLVLDELFALTSSIEEKLGKVPKPKTHPRPIDIDILFYGSQTFDNGKLTIPHPRWQERLFVLYPLKDLISTAPCDSLSLQERIMHFTESERQQIIPLAQTLYANSNSHLALSCRG